MTGDQKQPAPDVVYEVAESAPTPYGHPPLLITSPSVIFKYNPHRMPAEHVLATFVGREELLNGFVAHVRAQRGVRQPEHLFLHGPRGIGKTTMLLVLRYSVERDSGLSAAFDVVQFSEEERRVANLPSFAVRILELLARQRPDVAEDVRRAMAKPAEAMPILKRAAGRESGKQILLLLDNFDELVAAVTSARSKRFGGNRGQLVAAVRGLLRSPHFVVVATALQSPEKRRDFPRELLDCFESPVRLEPLSDAMGFLRRRAEQDRRQGFLDSLPRIAGRVEGLNRLAGGNPRLLVFLYDCLGHGPLPDLVEIVQRTVDDLTPMYQDVIDRLLNRGQAAVLEVLAERGGVGTPEELAGPTFQDEQTVRTFLGNLCDLGLVARSSDYGFPEPEQRGQGREVFRTNPPLFQIWYEMRHLNRPESLYLVHFFSLLTEAGEVSQVLGELGGTAAATQDVGLARMMEDVADVLDPEWSTIRETHVTDVLAQEKSLSDSLSALGDALAAGDDLPVRQRVGLLVVRGEVRRALGDTPGAAADLDAAERDARELGDADTQVKLLVARSRHLLALGETSQALEAAEDAVERSAALTSASQPIIQATASLALANVRESLGEYRPGLDVAEKARSLLASADAPRLQTRAESLCGNLRRSLGELAAARDCHERALQISREHNDRRAEAASLNNLGNVYGVLGEYGRARECHELALAIHRQIGDLRGQAHPLANIGNIHQSVGEYDRARGYYEQSLAINRQIGDRRGEAHSLGGLGSAWHSLKERGQARTCYERALSVSREIGDRLQEAASLGNLGVVQMSLGDLKRARECHEQSLAIQRQIGDRRGQAIALSNLGSVCQAAGEYDGARASYEQSLAIQREVGDRSCEAKTLNNLGVLARRQQEHGDALTFFQRAHRLFASLGERPSIKRAAADVVRSRFDLAAAATVARQAAQAEEQVRKALPHIPDAGSDATLSAFVNGLVVPCLQHSRELSAALLPYLDTLTAGDASLQDLPASRAIRAVLRFYAEGASPAQTVELGPADLFLVDSIRDRVERPLHVQARELLQGGRNAEAKSVLRSILDASPGDVEASLNLASAHVTAGEFNEARPILNAVLAEKPDLTPASLLLVQVEEKEGHREQAIAILEKALEQAPSEDHLYSSLAQLLRQEHRFADLAALLERWRGAAQDTAQKERLGAWLPEAYILAGDIPRAAAALPPDGAVVKDLAARLRLGIARVIVALYAGDQDRAKDCAAEALQAAVDAPPGRVPNVFSAELAESARGLLGEAEYRLLAALARALPNQEGPLPFAAEFLGVEHVREFDERFEQEGEAAIEAFRSGRIQGFGDLARITARSIGPAAALRALGEAFQRYGERNRSVLASLFAEAIEQGQAPEVTAALHAVGGSFPHLDASGRAGCLGAMLGVAGKADAAPRNRDQAAALLNVLYPGLAEDERTRVRDGLKAARETRDSRPLTEFFDETVPAVEQGAVA